ncbi:DUF4232 domain-containing protein [Streptomyces sp. NPDC059785]|uniref:DUF4232 domain-containing protein n=1 Tax=Streptomyces sp. NPDC059785 TaxID=3346945 RepID=UPI00365AE1AF
MRALPIAVAVLAAALTLSACDDSSDGTSAKGGSGNGNGSSSSSSSGENGGGCADGDVTVEVGPGNAAPAAGDTGNVPVTVTSHASAACTLKGFPGVELTGGGTSWKVPEQESANPQTVTLNPDEAAAFTLTYVRGEKADTDDTAGTDDTNGTDGTEKSAVVEKIKISLTGTGGGKSHPWSYGEVALVGADTPDASVSPYQVAGD